jgi:predicted RNA binding protein YcfA (HicA-like mRNA interferase family)
MPKLHGISNAAAVRAFERAGFRARRDRGPHTVMSGHGRMLVIPRHNPINSVTMGALITARALTVEEFRDLL